MAKVKPQAHASPAPHLLLKQFSLDLLWDSWTVVSDREGDSVVLGYALHFDNAAGFTKCFASVVDDL
jgi:hypothetical protein